MIGQAINPAVWNPPASDGDERGVIRGRSRYFGGEPPAPIGGGSTNLCNLSNLICRKAKGF